jgi:hypothetical protein
MLRLTPEWQQFVAQRGFQIMPMDAYYQYPAIPQANSSNGFQVDGTCYNRPYNVTLDNGLCYASLWLMFYLDEQNCPIIATFHMLPKLSVHQAVCYTRLSGDKIPVFFDSVLQVMEANYFIHLPIHDRKKTIKRMAKAALTPYATIQ